MAAIDLPQEKKAADNKWIFKALISFGIVFAIIAAFPSKDSPKAQASEEQKAADCIHSLQCWGDKYNGAVDADCAHFVERLAQYRAHWTDTGMFEPKFSRFRWLDESAATVTYIGDKVEFQNAYGAYVPIIYECDYDPRGRTVIDVRIRPGRL